MADDDHKEEKKRKFHELLKKIDRIHKNPDMREDPTGKKKRKKP